MRYLYTSLLCLLSISCFAQATAFTEYNINPTGDSKPTNYYQFKGKMFFTAISDTFGNELWVSDGTLASTHVLKDINPGKANSDPVGYGIADGLIFAAWDSMNGYQIWKTDGTDTGTHSLKKVAPSVGSYGWSNYGYFIPYKGKLYFGGYDSAKHAQLWVTDGTQVGTMLVKDWSVGNNLGWTPSGLTVYNSKLYFTAGDVNTGAELFVSDGSSTGTVLLKDIDPTGVGNPYGYTEYNGKLYFIATTPAYGSELWVTDGTSSGTQLFKDVVPGAQSGARYLLRVFNGKLYFTQGTRYDSDNYLWITDGTLAGTQKIGNVQASFEAPYVYGADSGTIIYKNKMYFGGDDSKTGFRLWESDGTVAGTKKVKDTFSSPTGFTPVYFTMYNNRMYFSAFEKLNVNPSNLHVYVSDGTDTGTHVVKPKVITPKNVGGYEFFPYKGQLYFSRNYNTDGYELWSLKDTAIPFPISVPKVVCNNNFSIYPNPNNGNFTLKLSEMPGSNATVAVFDITGKQVYSKEITQKETQLQLGLVPKGVYEVKVSQDKGIVTQKLVVE